MIHLLHEAVLDEGVRYFAVFTPDATPASHDDIQAELRKLDGSWALVYWLYDGAVQAVRHGRIIMSFTNGDFTIRDDRGVFEKGRIEGLAPDRNPKTFEYVPTENSGRPARLRYAGIYLVLDDLFIACIGYGRQRPGAFSTEADSRNELVVYKRLTE
jgi:uncharacterized protein (TIGR03067 family)